MMVAASATGPVETLVTSVDFFDVSGWLVVEVGEGLAGVELEQLASKIQAASAGKRFFICLKDVVQKWR
jgi:hypothetical protein